MFCSKIPQVNEIRLSQAGCQFPPMKHIVAITSCPTGIAHTLLAAEALKKAAAALGHDIKVETQGSVGAKNAAHRARHRRGRRRHSRHGHPGRSSALRRQADFTKRAPARRSATRTRCIAAALALTPGAAPPKPTTAASRRSRVRGAGRRQTPRRHHRLPHRHRAHFHGGGGVGKSGEGARAHDQGRDAGFGRREEPAHAGGHRRGRCGGHRRGHEGRSRALRRETALLHRHESTRCTTARR